MGAEHWYNTTLLLGHTSAICLAKQILEIAKHHNYSDGQQTSLHVFMELNKSLRRSFRHKLLTVVEMSGNVSSRSLDLCKLGFQANSQAKSKLLAPRAAACPHSLKRGRAPDP